MAEVAAVVSIVSVVVSGLVAVGGLVLNYLGSREQRDHEKRLSFEARIWETKSAGLFGVIAASQSLLDALDDREIRFKRGGLYGYRRRDEFLGATAGDVAVRLDDLVPVVEAYASAECRSALHAFRDLLTEAGADRRVPQALEVLRRSMDEAIGVQDQERVGVLASEEKGLILESGEALRLDRDEARRRAERLILSARESLRVAE